MLLNVMCANTINLKNVASLGLLQPLPIPTRNWSDILMDFIKGFPHLIRKDVLFVVGDQLSKYIHFIALSHLYSTKDIVKLFMNHVFRSHGMHTTTVSDGDPVFTITFWNTLFELQDTQLCMSFAYHP